MNSKELHLLKGCIAQLSCYLSILVDKTIISILSVCNLYGAIKGSLITGQAILGSKQTWRLKGGDLLILLTGDSEDQAMAQCLALKVGIVTSCGTTWWPGLGAIRCARWNYRCFACQARKAGDPNLIKPKLKRDQYNNHSAYIYFKDG